MQPSESANQKTYPSGEEIRWKSWQLLFKDLTPYVIIESIYKKDIYISPEKKEEILSNAFPYLKKYCNKKLIDFIENLFMLDSYYEKTKENHVLDWCCCLVCPLCLRMLSILHLCNNIIKEYPPETNNEIVHTDLGEEGCLYTYLVTYGLWLCGYKHVRLQLINLEGSILPQYAKKLKLDLIKTCTKYFSGKEYSACIFAYNGGVDSFFKQYHKKSHSIVLIDPLNLNRTMLNENNCDVSKVDSIIIWNKNYLDTQLLSINLQQKNPKPTFECYFRLVDTQATLKDILAVFKEGKEIAQELREIIHSCNGDKKTLVESIVRKNNICAQLKSINKNDVFKDFETLVEKASYEKSVTLIVQEK